MNAGPNSSVRAFIDIGRDAGHEAIVNQSVTFELLIHFALVVDIDGGTATLLVLGDLLVRGLVQLYLLTGEFQVLHLFEFKT